MPGGGARAFARFWCADSVACLKKKTQKMMGENDETCKKKGQKGTIKKKGNKKKMRVLPRTGQKMCGGKDADF